MIRLVSLLAAALVAGCSTNPWANKQVHGSYSAYGINVQAPPTPVTPPMGFCIGVVRLSYDSNPTSTNTIHAAK